MKKNKSKRFLGRTLNEKTMMWEFADKSGVPLSKELEIEMMGLIKRNLKGDSWLALNKKWDWEENNLKNN